MTRSFSPDGIPGENVAAYYGRRAEGQVGLIITEGTLIDEPAASFDPNVPHFHGTEASAGWKKVVDEVHRHGGKIIPQLWHVGITASRNGVPIKARPLGPSGIGPNSQPFNEPMSIKEIDHVIASFAKAATLAKNLGFDGVELHGAHGYLIDQFFWDRTNKRTDKYGGDLRARTTFAVEIIQEIRRQVGPDFPLFLRFSQWKQQDYEAKLATTPEELGQFLGPLCDAGVDVFHCSTRRFWEREFPDSELNLAGWTKKLTGRPVITVGSITLNDEFIQTFKSNEMSEATGIDQLLERLEKDEFDLVAIGRSLIVNPDWPKIVESEKLRDLRPFNRDCLKDLI